MNAQSLGLYIPEVKVSAWVAETHPKEAAVWLDNLPMANAPEAARELYQSLYTLNRQKLPAGDRLKLMNLYHEPVARVTESLMVSFRSGGLALSSKKRKLADFVRQLKQEMSIGFKLTMLTAMQARIMLSRKKVMEEALCSAMRYMSDVLCSCYQVYIPVPIGIWKEMHIMYQMADEYGWTNQGQARSPTIEQYYRDALLLGLCNPYQLPDGEWKKIKQFIDRFGSKVSVSNEVDVGSVSGRFLIDLDADRPPVPYPRDASVMQADHLRSLDTTQLTETVQDYIRMFKKGDPAARQKLGIECLGNSCLDMLRRMRRSWGLATGRRGDRIRKSGQCFIANSVYAIHYFASGQRPFVQPMFAETRSATPPPAAATAGDDPNKVMEGLDIDLGDPVNESYLDLDELEGNSKKKESSLASPILVAERVFRAESWQIRDESVTGLQLSHREGETQNVRVGDILGMGDGVNKDAWRIVTVRWVKTPKPGIIDIGVEILGGKARPVSLRRDEPGTLYVPALLLPPVTILKRPATLVVPAGTVKRDARYYVTDDDSGPARKVASIKLLERTAAFEHFVFANAANNS